MRLNSIEENATRESITHWENMKEWAEEQPADDFPDPDVMLEEIGENWHAEYCALCISFVDCTDCPYFKRYGHQCVDGAWNAVDEAETWKDWVAAADVMIKELKAILEARE